MALGRLEFERLHRKILPNLTAEERVLLEFTYGISPNGKGPKVILPPPGSVERAALWKKVEEKLSPNKPRRRGHGDD